MSENTNTPKPKNNMPYIIGFVVVVALVLVGISLPPISIWERFGSSNETTATNENSGLATAQATQEAPTEEASPNVLTIPNEIAVSLADSTSKAQVESVAAADLTTNGVGALPEGVVSVGNVYRVQYEGTAPNGRLALTLPEGANAPNIDLFGWDGSQWAFIPSQTDGQQLVSQDGALPQAVALTQSATPAEPAIGAEVLPEQTLPTEVLPLVSEVSAGTLILSGAELQGEITAVPTGPYIQLIRVTNANGIVDQQSLVTLLSDPEAQTTQINSLVEQATAGKFAGINLDYQDVPAALEGAFTTFVTNLATALHDKGLKLGLTLAVPQAVNGAWDTTGQNWPHLGQIADMVYMQLPLNPTVYADNAEADQLVAWAVRQIDRSKLSLMVNAGAVEGIGEAFIPQTNAEALAHFGKLQLTDEKSEVEPATAVNVMLDGQLSPMEWDGSTLTYKFSYDQNGQSHFVWLGSEAALSYRLRLASRYNLHGIAVRGLANVANPAGYATALQAYLGTAEAPQPVGSAIVWTVRNASDEIVASESGDALTYSWAGIDLTGTYTISAEFAMGDAVTPLSAVDVVVASLEPTPEPVAEITPTPEATTTGTTSSTANATPSPTTETEVVYVASKANAVVNTGSNLREGPGFEYGTIAGGITANQRVIVTAKSKDTLWLQIITPNSVQAWIFNTLITPDASLTVSALPVVEVAPPAIASSGGSGGSGSTGGNTAPPPVIAPVIGGSFALGGQTQSFANPSLMSSIGMTWVKFQHKWGPGDSASDLAGRIQQAHGNGFKVLLSIPGANSYPTSIDFAGYIEFLGGVAALGPDAIEVWNEMNIDFEWPAGQISPSSYVNSMLAPAYNKIKSVNPNVMVISGALAPTGYFGGGCGNSGCDDNAYLAGMAAAGAASYMDCVGAHYNAGATSPSQSSGHPAGGTHYSWYFQPTLDLYAGAFGKPVCFTELGYLSGEDFGGVPGRFSWASGTSVAEHAQWLGEAISLAGRSGRVRLVIVFNVDFTTWGDDPQAGYALIRPNGSCAACATIKQAMGK